MIQVGDKVKVKEDVWDDHRERSWQGWEGIVKEVWENGKYAWHDREDEKSFFVEFPKARGKWRTFDFFEDELEKL
jgi:hypothetical protein